MQDPAKELLYKLFATRDVHENFSEESVRLYNSLITDTKSPVIDFMLNHQKEVSGVMGEEQYKTFLTSKANSQISGKLMRLDIEKPESLGDFEADLKKITSTPLFTSNYSKFLADNLNNIKAKNVDAILSNSKKLLPSLNTADRSMVLNLNTNFQRVFKINVHQDALISLFEIAVECEQETRSLENYKRTLERLKNPQ
jgi:hypothetical protein